MNLTRCGSGHFYDQDKYGGNCPHCGAGGAVPNNDVTQALTQSDSGADVTVALNQSADSLQDAVAGAMASGANTNPSGDERTISFYEKSISKEPCVGWLVCIEGNHLGEDFRLKAGRNFIGRTSAMDIPITGDSTVSREKHAAVVYEPKQHLFLIQPGESKELCYLNDAVVLASQTLASHDEITIGETKLKFFPCCSTEFNWNDIKKTDNEENK